MFDSDEEAWNKLRLVIPNKFATLFSKESVSVLINNHKNVIVNHNRKYKEQQMKSDCMYRDYWYWKPVLYGITDDEYKIG